jgi:hypothetical protein
MSEETILIALLCFALGFMARAEFQRWRAKRAKKEEAEKH